MYALPEVLIQITDTFSCEDKPARLDATAVGGIPPYTYRWEPVEGLSDPNSPLTYASPGASTTYTVHVVDAVGRRSSHTVFIERRNNPVAKIGRGSATTLCAESEIALDGAASVDADGNPVAAYLWEVDGQLRGSSTSPELAPFVPQDGQVVRLTVQDEKGCVGWVEETLQVRPLPTTQLSFTAGAADACDGSPLAMSLQATDADGGAVASIEWDLDGDPSTIEATGEQTGPFPPFTGTVSVRVTDSLGCSQTIRQEVVKHDPPTPVITFAQGAPKVCQGGSVALDGSTSSDASGVAPASWEWDLDGDPSTIEWNGPTPPAIDVVSPRVARLTVTDAHGCAASTELAIDTRAPPSLTVSFEKGSPSECMLDPVALRAAGTDSEGGALSRVEWDFDGDPSTIEAVGVTTPDLRPAADTVVSVRGVDQFGCSTSTTVALTPRPLPTPKIAFTAGREEVCAGEAVQLSGASSRDHQGNAVIAYEWSGNGGLGNVASPITSAFIPATTHDVTLTVTGANGCSASTSQRIAPRALPQARMTFSSGGPSVCQGQSVALEDDGSLDADSNPVVAWLWDLDGDGQPDAEGPSSGDFSPTAGAEASLTVVDALGCTDTVRQSFDVGALPVPVIAFSRGSNAVCAGEDVVLDGSASTDAVGDPVEWFAWDLDGDPSSTEFVGAQPPAIVPTGATTIRLRVTDSRGCFADAFETLDALGLPQARITYAQGHASSCQGDAIVLSGATSTAGSGDSVASYEWEYDGNPDTVESTAATLSPLTPDAPITVRLRVTDANGCAAETVEQLAPRALPVASITYESGADAHCSGDTIVLSGATSVDADGNPVAEHAWDLQSDGSDDHFAATTPTLVSASPRTVTLRVRDAEGCESTTTHALAPRPLPTPQIAFVQGQANVCAGEAVELSASGSRDADNQPVASFAWDLDGDPSSVESSAPSSGIWTPTGMPARLTVTDSAGCSATLVQPITPRDLPTPRVSFVSGGDFVCDGDTVSLDASSSTDADGDAVAAYAWDFDGDPSSTESTAALTGAFAAQGAVRVTVTDGHGCSASLVQDIEVGPLPVPRVAYLEGSAAVCRGEWIALDGSGSTDALGGADVTFAWDLDGDGATIESTDATPGGFPLEANTTVRLRVVDSNGCSAEAVETLVARQLPIANISFLTGNETSCQGDLVTLTAGGSSAAPGTDIASYAWDLDGDFGSIESADETLNPMTPAGDLIARLRVTDGFGCVDETSQPIRPRALPTPRVAFQQGHANACAGDSVVLSGATSTDADGNPVASYAWDLDGDGTAEQFAATPGAIHPTQPRTVSLGVTDAQGCFASLSQLLEPRPLPAAQIAFVQGRADVCVGNPVELTAAGSRDADNQPVVAFAWDIDGSSGVDSTQASTGVYVPSGAPARVTVTDAQGCSSTAQQPIAPRALPTPVLSFAEGSGNVCAGDTVELSAAGSVDADGNPVDLVAWDFDGDGTADRFDVTSGSFSPTEGQRVKLTVVDHRACQASTEESFSVRALPVPQFGISGPRTFICGGDPVELDGSASRDGYGAAVASYAWDLDTVPGTIESTAAVTHSFVPSGPVSLEVSDGVCRATTTAGVPTGSARELFELGGISHGQLKSAVDIILVVDNSGSMTKFIKATEAAINDHFAEVLNAHNLDYRVIVISAFGRSTYTEICISKPLSDLNCKGGGGWWNQPPVFGPRFFHYDLEIGSRDGFTRVLESYASPDRHGLAPNGWRSWLRPGVVKAFIEITDDDTTPQVTSASFDSQLRALSTQHFGTANDRNYVWYGIFGMKENNPASKPYEPADPLVSNTCGQARRPGVERQKLSVMTGGLRFPICNPDNFDVMFERLAQSVIEIVRVDCEFELSDVEDAPDESTIAVEYTPGGGGNVELLLPVSGPEACTPNHFYREGTLLKLCPDACTRIQADTGASLALSGCHAPD